MTSIPFELSAQEDRGHILTLAFIAQGAVYNFAAVKPFFDHV